MKKEYLRLDKVQGPLIIVSEVENVGYDEIVEIRLSDGSRRQGRVVQMEEDKAIIQVFEATQGISVINASVSFLFLSERSITTRISSSVSPINTKPGRHCGSFIWISPLLTTTPSGLPPA